MHTSAPVTALRKDGQESVVSAMVDGNRREFRADSVLVAAGRVGNTDALDLAAAGVARAERGFVKVDGQLTTSQPNIWAIGDVKGGWMFTYVATYDGPIAALNAVKGGGRRVDYRAVPRVIFSDPALAAVGLTETEAQAQGYDVAVGSVAAEGARPLAIGDRRGRLKAVVNQADGEILGFHILAPHADDLLHEAVTAMYDHGTVERIGKSMHAHPTLSELVKAAARAAK